MDFDRVELDIVAIAFRVVVNCPVCKEPAATRASYHVYIFSIGEIEAHSVIRSTHSECAPDNSARPTTLSAKVSSAPSKIDKTLASTK